MNSVMMVKKAIRYSVVQNILQYYECPDSCNAECCSNGRIHIFEDEFNFLKENYNERTKGIKSDDIIPSLYTMDTPCPFLDRVNRCDIHVKRPTVCGMYPFKVNSSGTSLGLQPCPVGFEVIKDLASWAMNTISKTGISEDEKAEKIMEWKNTVESYEQEALEFHTRESLQEMQIPFEELEMFSMFLLSKKQ
ncbi:YkgJ family cysteine cluster protein [Methanococcoides sp. FTZ1]|uniref:YkgJ family cysteine cluster protein n=1 Tax=Methanococcoides sp. FTZ1 TaxID=3439061 RepID=UPI003F82C637